MKLLMLMIPLVLVGLTAASVAQETQNKSKPRKGRLQHVVCFKFKETATPAQIQELTKAFGQLPSKVKEIKDFEWGTNVSPEKHDKGFTHCFIVTFQTEQARDGYLVHPAHKEFVKLVGPIVADVFVVDFWSQK